MLPGITGVQPLQDHLLRITFSDGLQADLDFHRQVVGRGGVFTALEDVDFFRQVRVDGEAGTLVWPNGVDFCPDVLYTRATGQPISLAEPVLDHPDP
jgi:hypothetical protein